MLLLSVFLMEASQHAEDSYSEAEEGKEKKVNIDFEPFKPINTSLYLCDNKFHTEALTALLSDDSKFDFIVIDGSVPSLAHSKETQEKSCTNSLWISQRHRRGENSLTPEQEKDKSHFTDKETGQEHELIESMPLVEWFANNYKKFGATLEIVTDKSQEVSQFVKGFGGIGGEGEEPAKGDRSVLPPRWAPGCVLRPGPSPDFAGTLGIEAPSPALQRTHLPGERSSLGEQLRLGSRAAGSLDTFFKKEGRKHGIQEKVDKIRIDSKHGAGRPASDGLSFLFIKEVKVDDLEEEKNLEIQEEESSEWKEKEILKMEEASELEGEEEPSELEEEEGASGLEEGEGASGLEEEEGEGASEEEGEGASGLEEEGEGASGLEEEEGEGASGLEVGEGASGLEEEEGEGASGLEEEEGEGASGLEEEEGEGASGLEEEGEGEGASGLEEEEGEGASGLEEEEGEGASGLEEEGEGEGASGLEEEGEGEGASGLEEEEGEGASGLEEEEGEGASGLGEDEEEGEEASLSHEEQYSTFQNHTVKNTKHGDEITSDSLEVILTQEDFEPEGDDSEWEMEVFLPWGEEEEDSDVEKVKTTTQTEKKEASYGLKEIAFSYLSSDSEKKLGKYQVPPKQNKEERATARNQGSGTLSTTLKSSKSLVISSDKQEKRSYTNHIIQTKDANWKKRQFSNFTSQNSRGCRPILICLPMLSSGWKRQVAYRNENLLDSE
ncbi:Eukaryotic peptide chain release factor subunit 1 [Manis javanica]|nr:Eukaryotic peptide chain release factor subunit 1 [Manis javanica]